MEIGSLSSPVSFPDVSAVAWLRIREGVDGPDRIILLAEPMLSELSF